MEVKKDTKRQICLVIHGGAGGITRDMMSTEMAAKYDDKIKEVLEKSFSILNSGGSSIDAVEMAINIMENSTLFDAGKGSVLNSKGEVEMDASIMDGSTKKAGSVSGVKKVKHPISLARNVMDKTPHVMLFGEGADDFGRILGLELVTKEYFEEEPRYWEIIEHGPKVEAKGLSGLKGTVGAVAIDRNGVIAAGTSTGGTLKKMAGRVGDSPVIGAGTYADSETCGVSCTGTGEYFIRGVVAHNVSSLYEYKGMSIEEAAKTTLKVKVEALGGEGGIIALDKNANIAIVHNTPGMLRGYIKDDGVAHIEF